MQEELYGVEARVIRRSHLWTRFCGDAGAFNSTWKKGRKPPTSFVDGTGQAIRGDGATS